MTTNIDNTTRTVVTAHQNKTHGGKSSYKNQTHRSMFKINTPLPQRILRVTFITLVAIVMLVPLYIMVISAFKSQQEILQNPFGFDPNTLSGDYLAKAATTEKFNVIRAYGITLLFVLLVNLFGVVLAAPTAYIIARGRRKWHLVLLLLFVSGLFIPGQVTLIPVIYVLKTLGLIGTIPGFVLFETALTLPISIFLFTAYLRTIPRDIDEAAAIDGSGRTRTFWYCIFPIMTPAIATIVVLNSISIWNDFINPQIILGPKSGLYTVTTGVYAAVSQFSTDYTVVFPTLLLAVAPAFIFYIIMQRHIVGGLVSGSIKG